MERLLLLSLCLVSRCAADDGELRFKLPVVTSRGVETLTVNARGHNAEAVVDDWGYTDGADRAYLIRAVRDSLDATRTQRMDACARTDAWAHVPAAATNAYVVAEASMTTSHTTRRGNTPMLRVLSDRYELPFLLDALALAGPDATWVELGVFRGAFSEFLLRNSGALVHLVDVWDEIDVYKAGSASKNYDITRVRLADFGLRAVFHRTTTLAAAELFDDGSLDFVYLDATHLYDDVKRDLTAWWPKLRVGGLMAGDDYYNGYVNGAAYSFGVKDAVDEFFGGARDHRVYVTTKHDVEAAAAGGAMPQWYVYKCAE
jgi:predicted O-methyltransferase YrrM